MELNETNQCHDLSVFSIQIFNKPLIKKFSSDGNSLWIRFIKCVMLTAVIRLQNMEKSKITTYLERRKRRRHIHPSIYSIALKHVETWYIQQMVLCKLSGHAVNAQGIPNLTLKSIAGIQILLIQLDVYDLKGLPYPFLYGYQDQGCHCPHESTSGTSITTSTLGHTNYAGGPPLSQRSSL